MSIAAKPPGLILLESPVRLVSRRHIGYRSLPRNQRSTRTRILTPSLLLLLFLGSLSLRYLSHAECAHRRVARLERRYASAIGSRLIDARMHHHTNSPNNLTTWLLNQRTN